MELVQKHTTLETTDNVEEVLRWKLKTLQDEGLPVEMGISDYVALGIDNIEAQLQQLKVLKEEIKLRELSLKEKKTKILTGTAAFMEQFGAEKLQGNIISSITIAPAKEESETVKKVFKLTCSKEEMEKYLYDAGLATFENVTTVKPATPAMAKINKRRSQ